MKISAKVPAEIIPVTFDYSEIGITTIDSVATVGISLISGTDADIATMIVGAPTVSGATVTQLVQNGVAGCTYRLYCLIVSGSEKYQINGDMDVLEWLK